MTSPPKPLISAVLFDYGLVLSGPPDPAAWADMRHITGFSEEALHASYWHSRHAYDQGHLTGRSYWQQVTSNCRPALTPEALDHLLEADLRLWTQLNQPMLEWAKLLQGKGIKTGILSNLGDAMAAGVIAKFEWLAAFDHCTWSHTLKMAKPDLEIYRRAASGLATPLANILFIDDKPENVVAARLAGMASLQYNEHNAFLHALAELGLDHLLPATV